MTDTADPSVIDETHDPGLRSWVASAQRPGTDFPIQNLPFGRFRLQDGGPWHLGVAIGDEVLDLRQAGLVDTTDMAQLLSQSPAQRRALRLALSRGLREGSPLQAAWTSALRPQASVRMGLPCDIGDYTDFYIGIHHATAVGKLFRPDAPLLPNYEWVPIGYHGRSSTIEASGQAFRRPCGQTRPPGAEAPSLRPSARLDFELELGAVIGPPNADGGSVPLDEAEDHLFGLVLLNDWSARDIQAWEYQPLGPFLSKNFASTVSPWIVQMEALAPYRRPYRRLEGHPPPLPYLRSERNERAGSIDIRLEVRLQTEAMRREGRPAECITTSNLDAAAFWTLAQLVTHHTVNGCQLRPGDLLGSGTLSGPLPQQAGSLLELTDGGKRPIVLSNGEHRTFLEDGDTVSLQACCEADGAARIGFGPCIGTVLPARLIDESAR